MSVEIFKFRGYKIRAWVDEYCSTWLNIQDLLTFLGAVTRKIPKKMHTVPLIDESGEDLGDYVELKDAIAYCRSSRITGAYVRGLLLFPALDSQEESKTKGPLNPFSSLNEELIVSARQNQN